MHDSTGRNVCFVKMACIVLYQAMAKLSMV